MKGPKFLALACVLCLVASAAAGEPATGLQKPFPPLAPPDNPTTPEKIELGRLLFFDRILSGGEQIACADCHHPDAGLADGLPRARGWGGLGAGPERSGGIELTRGAPTLWNAAYNARQFWDGREPTLEAQARNPITSMEEMGKGPSLVETDLRRIPEYVRLFDRAFPDPRDSSVTFDNVVKAIAAFERTLITQHAAFDRYAAGDTSALSAPERRGLRLFFSNQTRCAECHELPTFSGESFKVVGVPDPVGGPADEPNPRAETGRGGGLRGAFKIPTLRNVALTAPYMHNGTQRTLEEVIDFYAEGGGRGKGLDVPNQDEKVRKFKVTPEEKADLVAFLRALTDESSAPAIPERVPSGLPVARSLRRAVLEKSALTPFVQPSGVERRTIDVHPGESIQESIDRGGRGATIRIHPGEYHESLLVIHHDVALVGMTSGERRATLDGRGLLSDGIVALGNRLRIEGLFVRRYVSNGILARGVDQVLFRDLVVEDPGLYGLYPVSATGVTVEKCRVSGASDAGVYVGQSSHIVVRDNDVFRNVAGIEIENSTDAVVERNHVHGNTGGILFFLLPHNPSTVADRCVVADNVIEGNNLDNFADPHAMVAQVRRGTGILVLAADRTEVTRNRILQNGSFGVAVLSLEALAGKSGTLDVDPLPDFTWVRGNSFDQNGRNPDPRLTRDGIPGRDLLWDGSGKGNRWHQPGASSSPEALPSSKE